MRQIIDPTVSKYPFQDYDLADVDKMTERVEDLVTQIEHLEKIQEAMEYDDNWRLLSQEFSKRLDSITRNFFANNNPSDPNIQVKFATAWGQFNEVLKLTESQIGVKNRIEQFKNEKVSVLKRIESVWNRIMKKRGESN